MGNLEHDILSILDVVGFGGQQWLFCKRGHMNKWGVYRTFQVSLLGLSYQSTMNLVA